MTTKTKQNQNLLNQEKSLLGFVATHPISLIIVLFLLLPALFLMGGMDGQIAKGRSLSQTGEDVPSLSASHAADRLFMPTNLIEDDLEILTTLDQIRRNKILPLSLINANSIYNVPALYADYNYHFDLKTMPDAPLVPRVALSDIPNDSDEIEDVGLRKSLFIQNMLPLVLKANENILVKRMMAMRLIEEKQNNRLNEQQRQWLRQFYSRYRVENGDDAELLKRIDMIPVSLALSQAAIESAWGTSRFARQGNALFGQWTWSQEVESITPKERDEGKTYAIRAFRTPLRAVESYMLNLNRHHAYEDLREARANLRLKNQALTPEPLIAGLSSYSTKRGEYLDMLQAVISQNNLKRFDEAKLAPVSLVKFPILSLAW